MMGVDAVLLFGALAAVSWRACRFRTALMALGIWLYVTAGCRRRAASADLFGQGRASTPAGDVAAARLQAGLAVRGRDWRHAAEHNAGRAGPPAIFK